MVSVEKAIIARLSKDHTDFEILVDPDKALEFRKGLPVSIENILAAQEIFNDAKKGERASSIDLEKAFNTKDVFQVAKIILKKGNIQLTTEQRRKLLEEKKKQIANTISKQGINPKTKLPHPQQRIMNAMDEAHVNIDPFRSAEEQIEAVLEKIQKIIPINLERLEIAIKIPMEYAGKASSAIRNMATLKKEEWGTDAWFAVIEIPAGIQNEVYSKLNDLTAGKVEVKIVKRKDI